MLLYGPSCKAPGKRGQNLSVSRQTVQVESTLKTRELFYVVLLDVFKNRGTSKSSILIGFSIINHPFCGTSIFGNIYWKPGLPYVFLPEVSFCCMCVFLFKAQTSLSVHDKDSSWALNSFKILERLGFWNVWNVWNVSKQN